MRTKIETNVEFGKKYQDKNTGLIGVAVSISKWQYGCIRIALQPKVKEDGTVPDAVWVDEEALIDVDVIDKNTGGPTPNPKNYSNPVRR